MAKNKSKFGYATPSNIIDRSQKLPKLCFVLAIFFFIPSAYTRNICEDLTHIYQDGLREAIHLADALGDAANANDVEAVNDLSDELDELGTFLHSTLHAMAESDCGSRPTL